MSVARAAFAVARRTAFRTPAPRAFSTIAARRALDHLPPLVFTKEDVVVKFRAIADVEVFVQEHLQNTTTPSLRES